MNFLKRPHVLRRFKEPKIVKGYQSITYEDLELLMDIQTMEDVQITTEDGTMSVQRLKVFCDKPILTEDVDTQQKADRVYFQGKWFECKSSRLSENTPLKHYTATFVELLDNEAPPQIKGGDENEPIES